MRTFHKQTVCDLQWETAEVHLTTKKRESLDGARGMRMNCVRVGDHFPKALAGL